MTLDQLKQHADGCRVKYELDNTNANYAAWRDAERAYAHEASIALMRGRISFTQAVDVQQFNRQIDEV